MSETEADFFTCSGQLRIGRYAVDAGLLILKLRPIALKLTRGHEHDSDRLVQRTIERLLQRERTLQVNKQPVEYALGILKMLFLEEIRPTYRQFKDLTDETDAQYYEVRLESWQATARLDIENAMKNVNPTLKSMLKLLVDYNRDDPRAQSRAEIAEKRGIDTAKLAHEIQEARHQFKQHLPDYLKDMV